MTDDSSHLPDTGPESAEDAEPLAPEEVDELEETEESEESGPAGGRADRGARAGRAAAAGLAATARRLRPGPLSRPGSGGGPPAASPSGRGHGFGIDPALRIQDRVSQAFVIGAVLIYAAIFLNAMAFGRGGAFSGTPIPSVSAAPSGSLLASPTIAPTAAPTATPTAIPTPTLAPTAAPTAP